jgi:hypothetical protein
MRKLLGYGILGLLALIMYVFIGITIGFLFATILIVGTGLFVWLIFIAVELITD